MTFFEWLFDIHRPPAQIIQVPLTPLKAIENELVRLHAEIDTHTTTNGPGYLKLIEAINKLNEELVRSNRETSNGANETKSG